MFRLVSLPFCRAVLAGGWNAPGERYFIAYRRERGFRVLLGHAVVDEFATFSSPLFFAPAPILGKIYDAGITLAHRRDPEMGIDFGWPPLCVGLDAPEPDLPEGWEETLLRAIQVAPEPGEGDRPGSDGPLRRAGPLGQPPGEGDPGSDGPLRGPGPLGHPPGQPLGKPLAASGDSEVRTVAVDGQRLSALRIGEARVLGTDVPLLPRQLARLCEAAPAAITLAFSTGNRVRRRPNASPNVVRCLSEARLVDVFDAARRVSSAL